MKTCHNCNKPNKTAVDRIIKIQLKGGANITCCLCYNCHKKWDLAPIRIKFEMYRTINTNMNEETING